VTNILHTGDCREVMAGMDAESVHSIVTDPPYGLSFMGKGWDHGVPGVEFWTEAMRVAKPGAHLLAFGGTRTYHRLACAIEDAGWEVRDCVMWVYGSGFPKSLDVGKAIDKAAGAEREVVGEYSDNGRKCPKHQSTHATWQGDAVVKVTAPATDAARQWHGWGTALKPAWEPIIVARKPLIGTVAANVQEHGCGAINVDGCRVGMSKADPLNEWGERYGGNRNLADGEKYKDDNNVYGRGVGTVCGSVNPSGRWPANFIHDGSDEVVGLMPDGSYNRTATWRSDGEGADGTRAFGRGVGKRKAGTERHAFGDSGSAARFFYSAKAGRSERLQYLTCNCETITIDAWVSEDQSQADQTDATSQKPDTSVVSSADDAGCSTSYSGSEPTGLFRPDIASTTSTRTSRTTDSKTSPASPTPNTNGFTAGASNGTVNGSSRAEFAASSSRSMLGTSTCHARDGRCTGVVVDATSPLSSGQSKCGVCGSKVRRTSHPTQKPESLMRYLCRLVTPPGGIVLDPFMGSGSTGKAAVLEGFEFVGIEREPEYVAIASRRIEAAEQKAGIFAEAV
jgi:DNA modification methylase